MAHYKSYTDIEQSRKLVDILPLESADGHWFNDSLGVNYSQKAKDFYDTTNNEYIPAWSLTALLGVLDYPQLSKDKLGSGKVGWAVSVYPNDCRYDSCWHDNPIDACYEMILKLHELNLL